MLIFLVGFRIYKRMWMQIVIVSFFVSTSFSCSSGGDGPEINLKGFLDEIIKNVLESLKPSLANLTIRFQDFDSGPQEFGNLKGHVKTVALTGLDNFAITRLETTLINVKNLTLVFEEFKVNGLYYVNGTLAFPLGRNDIHLFGAGDMSGEYFSYLIAVQKHTHEAPDENPSAFFNETITLTNFSVSTKMQLKLEDGEKKVSDLQIILDLKGMHVKLTDLMGGGDLEKVFNQIINDVVLTVFNYYKKPIVDAVKPQIIKQIEDFFNSLNKNVWMNSYSQRNEETWTHSKHMFNQLFALSSKQNTQCLLP